MHAFGGLCASMILFYIFGAWSLVVRNLIYPMYSMTGIMYGVFSHATQD